MHDVNFAGKQKIKRNTKNSYENKSLFWLENQVCEQENLVSWLPVPVLASLLWLSEIFLLWWNPINAFVICHKVFCSWSLSFIAFCRGLKGSKSQSESVDWFWSNQAEIFNKGGIAHIGPSFRTIASLSRVSQYLKSCAFGKTYNLH